MLVPSRRASFCSAHKSGEDVTTALVSSEVDEKQSRGTLASPLPVQKRAAGAAPARVYHCDRESSMSGFSCQSPSLSSQLGLLTQPVHPSPVLGGACHFVAKTSFLFFAREPVQFLFVRRASCYLILKKKKTAVDEFDGIAHIHKTHRPREKLNLDDSLSLVLCASTCVILFFFSPLFLSVFTVHIFTFWIHANTRETSAESTLHFTLLLHVPPF